MSDSKKKDVALELEEVKNEKRILSREILTLQDTSRNIFAALIMCQGMLVEMMKPENRCAFLSGRMGLTDHSDEMLDCIDKFSRIMLPSPRTTKGKTPSDNDAATFVTKLLSKDLSEPLIDGVALPVRKSFSEWRDVFHSLISSSYWLESVTSGRKEGEINVPPVLVDKGVLFNDKAIGTLGLGGALESDGQRRSSRGTTRKKERMESTAIKNSGYEASDSSSSEDDDLLDRLQKLRDPLHRRQDENVSVLEALQKLGMKKEVVPPAIFDSGTGASLKGFLKSFERYFDAKYEGNDRDRSRCLVKFLGPQMKSFYENVGGYQRKYQDVKKDLLSIYEAQRTSDREDKYNNFVKTALLPSESLSMYCIRLEHLARVAFYDEMERERQLCRKLLDSAPDYFKSSLEGARSATAILGYRKMTWALMKNIAEDKDRQIREGSRQSSPLDCFAAEPQVWHTRDSSMLINHGVSSTARFGSSGENAKPVVPSYSREFRSSARSPPKRGRGGAIASRSSAVPAARPAETKGSRGMPPCLCHWCGKTGHRESACWLKQGACSVCGSLKHNKTSCPMGRQERQRPTVTPVCSLCQGGHLGKDCTAQRNSTNF